MKSFAIGDTQFVKRHLLNHRWGKNMITYPTIRFECQVSGKKLIAEVVTQVNNLTQFDFMARFSDGFEDIFQHDPTRGIWKALRDKKSAYLRKIKDDLAALRFYQPNRHYLNFRHQVGQEPVNIWVFETLPEDGFKVYSVYYKGDYRFDMKKIFGVWYARSVRQDARPIDGILVDKIGEMIDQKMAR